MTSFFLFLFIFLISSLFELIMTFVCHYCGKSFISAEKARAHKAVHDETQLQCRISDKVFIEKKDFGTPVHKKMALKSLVRHNSKRAGFVSPSDFRLR